MNLCSVCGKHYMRHLSGNMLVGYVHYDHTKMCEGGTTETDFRRKPYPNLLLEVQ